MEFSCKHGNTALLNFQNYHIWKSALTVYLSAENAFEFCWIFGRFHVCDLNDIGRIP